MSNKVTIETLNYLLVETLTTVKTLEQKILTLESNFINSKKESKELPHFKKQNVIDVETIKVFVGRLSLDKLPWISIPLPFEDVSYLIGHLATKIEGTFVTKDRMYFTIHNNLYSVCVNGEKSTVISIV